MRRQATPVKSQRSSQATAGVSRKSLPQASPFRGTFAAPPVELAMSRSSPRLFRTAYFVTQAFADRNLPSIHGRSASLARACHAASWHLLNGRYAVAVVHDVLGRRSTTLTRKGRRIEIVGLLP